MDPKLQAALRALEEECAEGLFHYKAKTEYFDPKVTDPYTKGLLYGDMNGKCWALQEIYRQLGIRDSSGEPRRLEETFCDLRLIDDEWIATHRRTK